MGGAKSVGCIGVSLLVRVCEPEIEMGSGIFRIDTSSLSELDSRFIHSALLEPKSSEGRYDFGIIRFNSQELAIDACRLVEAPQLMKPLGVAE
jgi:hypothetical protein